METPAVYNLTMYQGASFDYTFTWKIDDEEVNLAGSSARMQVRRDYASDDVVLDLTNQEGITLGGAAGTILVEVDDETTSEIDDAHYVYDLELESPGGEVYRLLQGKFVVSPEVTRD